MIYITGDCHGQFMHILEFCKEHNTTTNDVLIILGDVGLNYYGENSTRDIVAKKFVSRLPITLFCIRGNHEFRPTALQDAYISTYFHGRVIRENKYPNIIYALDGVEYLMNDKRCLVIGGAYSVDKYYRLEHGWNWFANEQLDTTEKRSIIQKLNHSHNKQFDYVLTHTCPERYIPREWFLPMVDQSTVDNSMETFLDDVSNIIDYKKWYCGHYHGEKTIDNVEFLYNSIKEFV